MIPIRDTIRSEKFPVVTVVLIAINALVFLYEQSLGENLQPLVMQFGAVPQRILLAWRYFRQEGFAATPILFEYGILPLFTAMFLHGGWAHVLGNLAYLWIFGDNVEDRFGRFKYFVFYLLSGVCASLLHIAIEPTSKIPMVGASGAIAGVLGAYFVLFPKSRVLTLLPIFIFVQFIEVPALAYLGFWFLMQLGTGLLDSGASAGVAIWAHVGGFAVGVIAALLLRFFGYADEPHKRKQTARATTR